MCAWLTLPELIAREGDPVIIFGDELPITVFSDLLETIRTRCSPARVVEGETNLFQD